MASFQYQKTHTYFCQTPGGLEGLAAAELKHLGCGSIRKAFRGLHFKADTATLYSVNYQARLISRVLAPLASFQCRNRDDLYRAARSINWSTCFTVNNTFGIFANVSGNPNLRHSKFAALCLKDGVADYFRDRFGKRPDVDRRAPGVWLNLHVEKERGTISLDTSGGSLHRRGYREASVDAPIQEIVAAAVVALSGWDGRRPLYDPMCGSGTLLCEAALSASRTPAGYLRKHFGFRFLPDFDRKLWNDVKTRADQGITAMPAGLVAGSDVARNAVKASRINSNKLPHGDQISITRSDFRDLKGLENKVILCNPPYGIRLGDKDLQQFYRSFGDFLKQRCKGSQAFVYFGNREMLKNMGLKPSWKKPLRNAGLDGRLAKYELY